jgi:heterodisulfide reductase subunit D
MNALGVNYNIIEEEGCCANPLVWMGKTDEARKVAVETNMLFKRRKIGRLVTACAGCYHSFKEIWPKRLSVTPYPQVIHFSQFMDQLLSKGMVNFNKSLDSRVVYHDPCELGRHMGVYEEPRRVIRSIPGVKYFDTPYNRLDSKCCGGGGGTLPLYPEQDLKAAYSKLSSEVIPLQPNILVSSCPSCYITLKYAAESYDLNIEVIDLVQLVYRTL